MEPSWVTADGWRVTHLAVPVGSGLRRIACGRRIGLDVLEPAGDDLRRCARCLQSERRLNAPKPTAGARSRGDLAMEANYQRPVKAVLHVHLETGESWEATPADLEQFELTRKLDAYMRFDDALTTILSDAGLLDGDITSAQLNPVRYLAEITIGHPELLNHPEHEGWRNVVEIERALQQRATEKES